MKLLKILQSKLWKYLFPLVCFIGMLILGAEWIGGVGIVVWVGTIAFNELY